MPKRLNNNYDLKRVDKIRKEFERKGNGDLMQYTIWLENRILKAENTVSEFNLKLKKCSNRIDKIL